MVTAIIGCYSMAIKLLLFFSSESSLSVQLSCEGWFPMTSKTINFSSSISYQHSAKKDDGLKRRRLYISSSLNDTILQWRFRWWRGRKWYGQWGNGNVSLINQTTDVLCWSWVPIANHTWISLHRISHRKKKVKKANRYVIRIIWYFQYILMA